MLGQDYNVLRHNGGSQQGFSGHLLNGRFRNQFIHEKKNIAISPPS